MEKECSKCGVAKDIKEYHKSKITRDGYATKCKICVREIDRERYKKNPDARKKLAKRFRENHYELVKERKKRYCEQNKEKISKKRKANYDKNKDHHYERCRKWAANNGEKVNSYKQNYKKRMRANSCFRLNESVSKGIYIALAFKSGKGKKSWTEMVDYSVEALRTHCESKFTKGMNWDNYGKDGWHLDHIIPKHYFKYDKWDHPAFKACWSLSNLQPLWATTKIAISYGEDSSYVGNLDKQHRVDLPDETKDFLKSINN